MDLIGNLIHDNVVRASASTYSPAELSKLGLLIDANLSNKRIRSVGGYYPDIVIWRPDYYTAQTGQAVLVEIIETKIPLAPDINKWIALCGIGIRVNIVVPESQRQAAINIIGQYRLSNCFLQMYRFDQNQNRYIFTRI